MISCAWCLSEQGIPAGEGSHGICTMHSNRMLQEYFSMKKNENKSEVARTLAQIELAYAAARLGMLAIAEGTTRHRFITARMEHMKQLQDEIEVLVGEERGGKMVAYRLDQLQIGD